MSKAWNDSHPEKIRAACRRWRAKLAPAERLAMHRRAHAKRPVASGLVYSARVRAKKKGLVCTISEKDILPIPVLCPVLAIPLLARTGGRHDGSPTLDRIDNTRGYVPGNVVVISWRANRLKSDATLKELLALAAFYSSKGNRFSVDPSPPPQVP